MLIHSGAGGVGVAAIALAQRLGAEIYATAGSAEKRDYLKSLGVRAVMDSRSLGFADEVLAATGGEGVDLVLNALPGPFIEKGLACLAPSGRFIELGKRDIYDDRALGLKALRRNISLHVVDLAALIDERPALMRALMDELIALFASGEIAPPPLTVFPAGQVIDAFRYFAQGKHIGKIVVDMRDPDAAVRAAPGRSHARCQRQLSRYRRLVRFRLRHRARSGGSRRRPRRAGLALGRGARRRGAKKSRG